MNINTLKQWAESLKTNTYALYLCTRDPRVPRLAKFIIGLVVAYAASPIDLIPDFIPILGYLDDLLLLPLGIWLAIRLVPEDVWHQKLVLAATSRASISPDKRVATIIFAIWIAVACAIAIWCYGMLFNGVW